MCGDCDGGGGGDGMGWNENGGWVDGRRCASVVELVPRQVSVCLSVGLSV